MPDSSKPTDWLNKIPGLLTATFALIGTVAAFVVNFREKQQLFIVVTIALFLIYLLTISIYILFARRKARSKKDRATYQYGRYRLIGLIGVLAVCLTFTVAMATMQSRQFIMAGLLGTPTLSPTSTSAPTSTSIPTSTIAPTSTPPQLGNPDVLIAKFDGSNATFPLDVAGQLEGKLSKYLHDNGLSDVNLQLTNQAVSSEAEAQDLVNTTKTKVLIWGRFDDTYIQVRVFLSGGGQTGTEVSGINQIGLTSSEPPSF